MRSWHNGEESVALACVMHTLSMHPIGSGPGAGRHKKKGVCMRMVLCSYAVCAPHLTPGSAPPGPVKTASKSANMRPTFPLGTAMPTTISCTSRGRLKGSTCGGEDRVGVT